MVTEQDPEDGGLPNPPQPEEAMEQQTRQIAEQVRDLLVSGDAQSAMEVLTQLHPADQSQVVIDLPSEPRESLLTALPVKTTAQIIEEMHPEDAASLAGRLEPSVLSSVLDAVSPDVAADVLHQMPEERVAAALQSMEESERVIPLLGYRDDTAGGLMTTDYAAIRADIAAGSALDTLRFLSEQGREPGTVFTIDAEGRLVGQLSVRRLALARPSALVADLMEPVPSCALADTDQEECARLREHYDLPEVPVTSPDGRLLGVIPASALQDVTEREATEDMFRIAGMPGERLLGPTRRSVRSRLPWLAINLGTTFLAAAVVGLFQSTIAKAVVLAAFLPVVAGQGGIGGTQTLTLVVRGIAMGEMTGPRAKRLLARETLLGALHGVLLGIMVAVVAFAWHDNLTLSVVLGVAMLGNMLVAGFVGAAVPLLLRRLGFDPAVSSAVVVTTATDVIGFSLFLGFATLVINRLA